MVSRSVSDLERLVTTYRDRVVQLNQENVTLKIKIECLKNELVDSNRIIVKWDFDTVERLRVKIEQALELERQFDYANATKEELLALIADIIHSIKPPIFFPAVLDPE
jgi:hypothetical protein